MKPSTVKVLLSAALFWVCGSALAGLPEGISAWRAKDYAKAIREFRPLAMSGNAAAQYWLGFMHFEGDGVPRNPAQALVWFRKSAEQGDGSAQVSLAMMFEYGRDVGKDDQQAIFWYRKAAEQGVAQSQFKLGSMYARGVGVPDDDLQAVFWYRQAAEQGYTDALWALGSMYESGRGVPKDDQQAVVWYRKAADQGHAQSQFYLGIMYARGAGVPKDDQQSYFWFLLAASSGPDDAAKVRDAQGRMLTPEQRANAQAAARNWKPQTFAQASPPSGSRVPQAIAPTPRRSGAPSSTGTGFYVAPSYVVTNHHVTEGCQMMRVGGQTVTRSATDAQNDLSLIALPSASPAAARVRLGRVNVGESVIVAGFPLTGVLSGINITTGNVSSLAGIGGDTRLVQITAPVQTGNSGGPLLDASSNVIGVVVSKLNALKVAEVTGDVPQNVNFAINVNVLASFLDANGVEYKTSSVGTALPPQEIARRATAFTVLIECWN